MEKEKRTWTVALTDGTKLENLTLNGNNFISDTELTSEMFEGKFSKVTATDGDNTIEWNNAELVQITHPDSRWWFILREIPEETLYKAAVKAAQLDADEMIADQEERLVMLELGLN